MKCPFLRKDYSRLFSFLLWLIENPTLDSKFTSCLGTSFHSQLGHLIRCNLENITNFWIYNNASLTEENPKGNDSRVTTVQVFRDFQSYQHFGLKLLWGICVQFAVRGYFLQEHPSLSPSQPISILGKKT